MEIMMALAIGLTLILIIVLVILISILYRKKTTPKRSKIRYKVSSLKRAVEDPEEE